MVCRGLPRNSMHSEMYKSMLDTPAMLQLRLLYAQGLMSHAEVLGKGIQLGLQSLVQRYFKTGRPAPRNW